MNRDEIVAMLTAKGFNILPPVTIEQTKAKHEEIRKRNEIKGRQVSVVSKEQEEKAIEEFYKKGRFRD